MDAVSEHSTMKVDSPAMMRSEAPRRVKIRSATDRRQEAAGTQQPIWARTTARQVARSRVLLPPMLGPVSSNALACLQCPHSTWVSLCRRRCQAGAVVQQMRKVLLLLPCGSSQQHRLRLPAVPTQHLGKHTSSQMASQYPTPSPHHLTQANLE